MAGQKSIWRKFLEIKFGFGYEKRIRDNPNELSVFHLVAVNFHFVLLVHPVRGTISQVHFVSGKI
jgi:hypothetical protein